jgi:hypothetical protein
MTIKNIALLLALETFLNFIEKSERNIRLDGYRGRLPPDFKGDYWDEEFAAAYQAIGPFLKGYRKVRYFAVPSGLAFCPTPIKAETACQALMYLLNPPEELFGETGILDTDAYKAIKAAAILEIQQRDEARTSRVRNSSCSRAAKTNSQLIDLRGLLLDHHIPKGKPLKIRTLTSAEIEAHFGWSQSTVSRRMSKLFKTRKGMSAYAAVFGTHSATRGYKTQCEDAMLTIEALWHDHGTLRHESEDED